MNLAPVAQPHPPIERQMIGRVDVKLAVDPYLVSDVQIGREEGYASVDSARRALAQLTRGDAPAGALFAAADGRFYTTSVLSTNLDYDVPYHAGRTWPGERGARVFRDDVLVVVDGPVVIGH